MICPTLGEVWVLKFAKAGVGLSRLRRSAAVMALFSSMLVAGGTLSSSALAQEQYQLKQGKWQKQAPVDPATPEGKLVAIRALIEQGEPKEAAEQATEWIDNHPNHPALIDAYMVRADAQCGRRRYYKALYDFEYVIRYYPGSEQFNVAMEREFEIAKLYVHGVKRYFLGMPILPAYEEGEEILIRIQERAPGSDLGERASLELSDYFYRDGKMTSAAEAYDLFLQNYPRSLHRERVLLRLIQANLATFKGPKFDSTGLIEAQQRIRQYEKEFPAAAEKIGTSALSVRIGESLALKGYYIARWYERTGETLSAVYTYRRIVKDSPRAAAAQLALSRLEDLDAAPVAPAPGNSSGGATSTSVATKPSSATRASQSQTLPYEQLKTTQPSPGNSLGSAAATRPAPTEAKP
jgi:outer membrane protein assembly factor BamD (BamD/ComL family)